jgi:hypothetical protein
VQPSPEIKFESSHYSLLFTIPLPPFYIIFLYIFISFLFGNELKKKIKNEKVIFTDIASLC